MFAQPIAAFFDRNRVKLRGRNPCGDSGIVDVDDRRQIRLDGVADFHFFCSDGRSLL